MVIPVPVNIAVFVLFGLAYGAILSTACVRGVFRLTGRRGLDAYGLAWILGLLAGLTVLPALYLGLGFNEFSPGPVGQQLTRRLHWLGRGQITYICVYGLLILLTVRQR
jgi:hypothetical protein